MLKASEILNNWKSIQHMNFTYKIFKPTLLCYNSILNSIFKTYESTYVRNAAYVITSNDLSVLVYKNHSSCI